MKRDMELIRDILLALEEGKHGNALIRTIQSDEYSKEQIQYHAALLVEAGYIHGVNISQKGVSLPQALPESIAWAGHEFLDAARDRGRWDQAKAIMMKAGGFSLSVMKEVLIEILKKQVMGQG